MLKNKTGVNMSDAARLLKVEEKVIGIGTPCVLLVDVSYKRWWDGATVNLSKGDKLFIDMERGQAANGSDFFRIWPDEYCSLLQ